MRQPVLFLNAASRRAGKIAAIAPFLIGLVALVAIYCALRAPGVSAHAGVSAPGPDQPSLDCGVADDRQVHLPPDWKTFTPPDVGGTYRDPAFGCQVTRLTNSSVENPTQDGKRPSLMNYYSTFTAINAGDTMVLITADNGSWRVKGFNGELIVAPDKMPSMNNGHPVWDAANANVFYYTSGKALEEATISGKSVKSRPISTFAEYSGIVSPDAADLSQDGDHIALVGQNPNRTMDVFVWSLSRHSKTSTYTTQCTIGQWPVTETPQPGCLHKLQLTPDNLLSIEFAQDGTGVEQGLRLWNGTALVHLQDSTDHYDTGFDLAGNPVFISTNNQRTLAGLTSPCSNKWGLDIRQIHQLSSAICLLDHQPESHISYRGGESQPWMALSFFDERKSGPERFNNDGGFQAPTEGNWGLYEDEIILARVDAKAIYRLAHARSRSATGYWDQPHAAISRDGKYLVFTSNMAYPNGCTVKTVSPNECTDVYLIKLQ